MGLTNVRANNGSNQNEIPQCSRKKGRNLIYFDSMNLKVKTRLIYLVIVLHG